MSCRVLLIRAHPMLCYGNDRETLRVVLAVSDVLRMSHPLRMEPAQTRPWADISLGGKKGVERRDKEKGMSCNGQQAE